MRAYCGLVVACSLVLVSGAAPPGEKLADRTIQAARGLMQEAGYCKARSQAHELRAIVLLLQAQKMIRENTPRASLALLGAVLPEFDEEVRKGIPATDVWGGSYYYYSDGRQTVLIAPGRDRKLDAAYSSILSREAGARGLQCGNNGADLDRDSIYIDGIACRWNDFESPRSCGPESGADDVTGQGD